jgi:endonuclease III
VTLQERYSNIVGWFEQNAAGAKSELQYKDSFQLIVAVVLSAQCTDKRVNLVTPALFDRFPTPREMAAASFDDVYELIRSVSYPRSKATHLIGLANKLLADFGGQLPSDVDSLMTLPGVGRKTANVVASIIFGAPVIAVDTHVQRVARRLGLSDAPTPEGVEKDLEARIPEEKRATAHHWLLLHGRYVCTARAPKCGECSLKPWCRNFESEKI